MLSAFRGLTINGQPSKAEPPVEDITKRYFSSCSSLELGELVCLPDFSLQDSIAALEIMDPKMDNGIVENAEEEQRYDCSKTLLPDEILAIIDQLFASEMSWHGGSSLPQTLFTCVYVQQVLGKSLTIRGFNNDESSLLNQVLFPYVVATVKCSEICRDEYLTGYLYEEEDISSADYGLDFLPFMERKAVIDLLEGGLAWLCRQEQTSIVSQLALRLEIRLAFYGFLERSNNMQQNESLGKIIQEKLTRIVPAVTNSDELSEIFNTRIQRTLASTTPPRPLMSISIIEAFSQFKRMCIDLVRIQPVNTSAKQSPNQMLAFFEHIRRDNPQPLPFIRSRLQTSFLDDKMAQHHVSKRVFIVQAIESTCGPRNAIFDPLYSKVEIPSDKRYQLNRLVDDTIRKIDPPFLDLFKVLCHNPGRQRRNLCKLLTDFDLLQNDCEIVDQEISELLDIPPTFTISSWMFDLKLSISIKILLIGFELDLYKPFEWTMMYWHINNSLQLQTEHLYSLIDTHHDKLRLGPRILHNEAIGSLCRSYMSLIAALALRGLITRPTLKFSNEELLYRHRMHPWSKLISPPVVDYKTYKKESRLTGNVKELLQSAHEGFTATRVMLTDLLKRSSELEKSEMKGLLGCCITNGILMTDLTRRDDAWWKGKKLIWTSKFTNQFPCITIE